MDRMDGNIRPPRADMVRVPYRLARGGERVRRADNSALREKTCAARAGLHLIYQRFGCAKRRLAGSGCDNREEGLRSAQEISRSRRKSFSSARWKTPEAAPSRMSWKTSLRA